MPLTGTDRLLWAFGFFSQFVLILVFFAKGRVRRFPMLAALVGWSLLRTVVLFLAWRSGSAVLYTRLYFVGAAVSQLLFFCVFYEIASHIFRPAGRWAADAYRGAWALLAASVLVAAGLTWMAGSGGDWRMNLLQRSDLFFASLMSQLFLWLILLSSNAGLPWRTHVTRIAAGLGSYALLVIFLAAAHSVVGAAYGNTVGTVLSHVRMSAYILCVLFWTAALWKDAPEPKELPEAMEKFLVKLQGRLAYDLLAFRGGK